MLIVLCIVKLIVLKPNCEETSVWVLIFSSLVGYIFTKPLTMSKIISTSDRSFIPVVDPSGYEFNFQNKSRKHTLSKFEVLSFSTTKCNQYTKNLTNIHTLFSRNSQTCSFYKILKIVCLS